MSSMRAGTMRIDHRADVLSSTAANGAEATTSPSFSCMRMLRRRNSRPPVSDRLTTTSSMRTAVAAELGVDAALDRLDEEVERDGAVAQPHVAEADDQQRQHDEGGEDEHGAADAVQNVIAGDRGRRHPALQGRRRLFVARRRVAGLFFWSSGRLQARPLDSFET